MESWILGIVGFAGFEGLRLYKSLLKARSAVPQKRYGVYAVALLLLALFAAFAAEAMAGANKLTALFIGFSVPTGLKTFFDESGVRVDAERFTTRTDDVRVITIPFYRGLYLWSKNYFNG